MSGQGTPCRMPKSSPNLQKQGPLKATIPMSSVMKQNSNLKASSSATVSPTYLCKNRISPEQSSGQRSPGSSCKGTAKTLEESYSQCGSIRRTASLDTIYLKGHWPRDLFYWHLGTLQIDKATQTDESDHLDEVKVQSISENSEKLEKLPIRPVIRSTKDSGGRHGSPGENTLNSSSQTLSSCILSPTFKPSAINLPAQPLPKPSMRSSVEGLNQEIERIVLKTGDRPGGVCGRGEGGRSRGTPEGHRAPLAELLRGARSRSACARSTDTQTPREGSGGSRSSEDSQGSSPDQETSKLGSSPQINKFLAREPPDGCEKVHSKSLDERRSFPLPVSQPPSTFKLKPSLGSAFQSLQPNVSDALERDLPLVPSRRDDK